MEEENELLPVNVLTDEKKPEALTTVELDKDKIITGALTMDDEQDTSEPVEVMLTENQLNTIIVALGMLPMLDIVEDAEEDYDFEGELSPNHDIYEYLLSVYDGIKLKNEG